MSASPARALAGALQRQVKQVGASTPSVAGGDWQTAVVTGVPGDGTVEVGAIIARCAGSYPMPAVGDTVFLARSGSGGWAAVARVDPGIDSVGQSRSCYKQVSTPRASNTVNTADPDLQLGVAANAVYKLDGWIITSNTAMVGDLKCSVTGPAGALGRWQLVLPSTTAAADPDAVRVASAALGSTLAYGNATTGQSGGRLSGTIVTAAAAGTCAFSWAQQTSDATATNILIYSWMTLTRIA